jgi:hypothetical protein
VSPGSPTALRKRRSSRCPRRLELSLVNPREQFSRDGEQNPASSTSIWTPNRLLEASQGRLDSRSHYNRDRGALLCSRGLNASIELFRLNYCIMFCACSVLDVRFIYPCAARIFVTHGSCERDGVILNCIVIPLSLRISKLSYQSAIPYA